MPATTEPAATPAEAEESSLVFCHFGPAKVVPSLSSFALKLETYLRMMEISYKQEFTLKSSSKGKQPFIKDGGKELGDTNFIIPYLNKKFNKDLNASLSDEEKAISVAFKRLIEENLYWTLLHFRWMVDWPGFSKLLPITGMRKKLLPLAAPLFLKPNVKSNLHGHGMGRHSHEEIKEIAEKDLHALSKYLGSKQFFMGDEPTEIDASLFGFLAQALYTTQGSYFEKLLKEDLKNLGEYTERMREKYFPDWDQKLLQEKKKEEEPTESKKDTENDKENKNGAAEKVEDDKNGSAENEAEGSSAVSKDEKEKSPENEEKDKVEEVGQKQESGDAEAKEETGEASEQKAE